MFDNGKCLGQSMGTNPVGRRRWKVSAKPTRKEIESRRQPWRVDHLEQRQNRDEPYCRPISDQARRSESRPNRAILEYVLNISHSEIVAALKDIGQAVQFSPKMVASAANVIRANGVNSTLIMGTEPTNVLSWGTRWWSYCGKANSSNSLRKKVGRTFWMLMHVNLNSQTIPIVPESIEPWTVSQEVRILVEHRSLWLGGIANHLDTT